MRGSREPDKTGDNCRPWWKCGEPQQSSQELGQATSVFLSGIWESHRCLTHMSE